MPKPSIEVGNLARTGLAAPSDLQQMTKNRASKLHEAKVQKVIEFLTPCTPEELGSLDWLQKVNARSMIWDAMHYKPVRYVEQLVQQKKLTILIHDAILATLWREEILPQLMEAYKDPFCGTTASGVPRMGQTCMVIVLLALRRPGVLHSLGSDILDCIEYSVKNLQYFIQRNPDHDPAEDVMTDAYRSSHEMNYTHICADAGLNVDTLLRLARNLDQLPKVAAQKLLHSDTVLVSTVLELLIVKPFRYSVEEGASIAADSWQLLREILVKKVKLFPAARQITPECYEKLKKLAPVKKAKKYLGKNYLTSFEVIDSSSTEAPPPRSPHYDALRLEFAKKKEAIVAIHGAMGTFEYRTGMSRFEAICRAFTCFAEDPINVCFNCAQKDAPLRCGRCNYAYYCDRKCQKTDWTKHKLICDRKDAPIEVGLRNLAPACGNCPDCKAMERKIRECKARAETGSAGGADKPS